MKDMGVLINKNVQKLLKQLDKYVLIYNTRFLYENQRNC